MTRCPWKKGNFGDGWLQKRMQKSDVHLFPMILMIIDFFSFWGSLLMATMTPLLWRFCSQATSENSMEMLLAPQTAPTDSLPEAP